VNGRDKTGNLFGKADPRLPNQRRSFGAPLFCVRHEIYVWISFRAIFNALVPWLRVTTGMRSLRRHRNRNRRAGRKLHEGHGQGHRGFAGEIRGPDGFREGERGGEGDVVGVRGGSYPFARRAELMTIAVTCIGLTSGFPDSTAAKAGRAVD